MGAVLRNTPMPPLSLDVWREFRDHLVPHGVFSLLAYHHRSWPEELRS